MLPLFCEICSGGWGVVEAGGGVLAYLRLGPDIGCQPITALPV